MKSTRIKLNSSRGASMMMALVFLLCALVLGAIALTAASVNVGRTARNRDEQQLYYTLSSAASLIEADMKNAGYTNATVERSTETWVVNGVVGGFSAPDKLVSSSFTVATDSKLLYALKDEITDFYGIDTGIETTKSLPLSFDAGDGMPQVDGTLTLYKGGARNYAIEFNIYIGSASDKTGEMTLSFTPNLDNSHEKTENTTGDEHIVTTTDKTTVTWSKPTVSKGGAT